jgi:lambda family phage tail tape measure protein
MAVIGSLSVKLGLVTIEWDQATAKAKQQAKDLQKSFNSLTGELQTLANGFKAVGGALGLGAIGFAALTQQTLEFANATQDLAKGFDISIAKVLQFQDAIKTSGGNAEGASKMLSTLFSKIEDAQGGNEAAIAQFEKLGITFAELKALKPEEAINRIFNALNEQSLNTFQRVKMVKEMLGKQGVGLAIDEVAAKLNMSVEAYRKNEAALKKLAVTSDNLKSSMDNLKLAFADIISPFAGEGLVSVEKFRIAIAAIASVYVISNVVKLAEAMWLVYKALKANAVVVAAISAAGGWKGIATILGGLAVGAGVNEMLSDDSPTGKREASGKLERMDGEDASDPVNAGRRELVALNAKIALQEKLTNLEHQQRQLRIDGLRGDKTSIELRGVELALQTQLENIAANRAQALNKENLSEDQRAGILAEHAAEEAKARSKARDDKAFITAQEKLSYDTMVAQTGLLVEQLSAQMSVAELKYKGLTTDEATQALAETELQYQQEKTRLLAQYNADKLRANQTDSERRELQHRFDLENNTLLAKRNWTTNSIMLKEAMAIGMLKQQTEQLKQNLDTDTASLNLKLKMIGVDEKAAALAELSQQVTAEKLRVQQQYETSLASKTLSETQREELGKRQKMEMAAINDREIIQTQIINRNYQDKVEAIGRARILQKQMHDLDVDAMTLEQVRHQMRDSDVRLAQEELASKRIILQLNEQISEAATRLGSGEAYEAEVQRIKDLIAAEQQLSAARKQAIQDEEARRKSFTEGFNSAARQFAVDAENYGRLGADMFGAAIGNMNSAIDNFVRTGKFNFKDFAKSIIQDIMAMILKFQAMQLVMMGMRAMGFGGFGGAPSFSAGTGGASYAAAGGEIDGPTIVGENGPELFIPQRRGTVIPNMQASSFMGGQPSVVYNGPYIQNMNAIDTQSATQFLSKNKSAVWSANQSAQRSLPVSK